jgi:Amt family ammonium transporter
VQLLGVTVCAVWAIGTSAALLFVIKKTMGLRVSPEEEIAGVSIAGEHAILPAEPALTEHELLELLGGDG